MIDSASVTNKCLNVTIPVLQAVKVGMGIALGFAFAHLLLGIIVDVISAFFVKGQIL